MRSTLGVLAVLISVAVVRGDDADDARAIVVKSVKAHGYKEDDKLTAMTWKDKGKFSGGGFSMDYTADWAFQGPDKYRFAMAGEFGGVKIAMSVVANGDKAWQSMDGKTEEITAEKLEYVVTEVYQLHVTSLLPLLADKEFKLATAGEKDIDGKKATAVKVSRAKRPDMLLYFDNATSLLAKTEIKVKDEFQGWKEVLDEAFFSDYAKKDGHQFFQKMKVVRDGKTMIESTMSDQKVAEKLDPKLFDKP
jgi:outer membrane lipoprotein-sorting protein